MRHDIRIEGCAFRLRPLTAAPDDAAFVVGLRTDPELGALLNETSPVIADQIAWTERYFAREGDYYFIVEDRRSGAREGAVAIYDLDPAARVAEWGRWIMRRGSWAAIETAWLVYRVGFGSLGLEQMYCRTVAKNAKVVSFHTSCGLETARQMPNYVTIRGVTYDSVEQTLTRARWPEMDARLERQATRLHATLSRA